jgi:hypothetical protein
MIWFRIHFLPHVLHPAGTDQIAIAKQLKVQTRPDQIIVIYGQEWSPVIPYYAERRALMEPTFVPESERISRMEWMLSPKGRAGIGAIVRCPSRFDSDPRFAGGLAAIAQIYPRQEIGGCDVYVTGSTRRD